MSSGFSQTNLNLGVGYFGQNITDPGGVFEFEIDKFYGNNVSLPLKFQIGGFVNKEYNALFIEAQKGIRKQFDSGFFMEQSLGLGMFSKVYDIDGFFYFDKYGGLLWNPKGPQLSAFISASLGLGYSLENKNGVNHSIWMRPKLYFDFGLRGLHQPYAALQFGISRTIKTK